MVAKTRLPAIGACHCFVLRRAARRLTQFYDEMLAPTNLRISQFSLLALVYELGAPTMNEIAELIELDRTTAGKNLQPLERAGLITTSRSTQDGRVRVARLTEQGRATLKEASVLWRSAQRHYEQANGHTTLAEFERGLTSFRIPRLRKRAPVGALT